MNRSFATGTFAAAIFAGAPAAGAAPVILDDIQWMPPGTHQVTPSVNGKPKRLTIQVDQALAEKMITSFRELQALAAAGTEDVAFVDYAHKRDASAGQVTDMYWGGEDPKKGGIRIKVTWTAAARASLADREYRRFSPMWGIDPDTDEPVGLSANLGGLVNHAAFQDISPVVYGARGNLSTVVTDMDPKEITAAITAAISAALAPVTTRLNSLEAAAGRSAEGNTATAAAAAAGGADALDARLKALEKAQAGAAVAHADRCIAAAVQAGRLLPQDAEAKAFWRTSLASQGEVAEAQLAALPVKTAGSRVVANGSSASDSQVVASASTAEGFVATVKAAKAAAPEATAAAALRAAIQTNPAGYQAWRDDGGKLAF